MVNIVTIMDDCFIGGNKEISPSSLVILKIIPDLYLRQENQESILVNEITQKSIEALSQKKFPLIRMDYWPSNFGKNQEGRLILVSLGGNIDEVAEKGLFYRDKDIIFFQRLPKNDSLNHYISLMEDYLRRYGIILPKGPLINLKGSQSKKDILWNIIQGEFQNFKSKFLHKKNYPSKNPMDPLLNLFSGQRKTFWRDLITKVSLGALIISSGIGGLGHYYDRLTSLEEIERLQSEVIDLTPKQLKTGKIFEKLRIYQQNRIPINFDFAPIIISTWQNRLVITSMEWGIDEGEVITQYTLSFNPEEKGENDSGVVEEFVYWIETQHPRVKITEKDTPNGSIHLMVPTL